MVPGRIRTLTANFSAIKVLTRWDSLSYPECYPSQSCAGVGPFVTCWDPVSCFVVLGGIRRGSDNVPDVLYDRRSPVPHPYHAQEKSGWRLSGVVYLRLTSQGEGESAANPSRGHDLAIMASGLFALGVKEPDLSIVGVTTSGCGYRRRNLDPQPSQDPGTLTRSKPRCE
jgi:hypothetical protein